MFRALAFSFAFSLAALGACNQSGGALDGQPSFEEPAAVSDPVLGGQTGDGAGIAESTGLVANAGAGNGCREASAVTTLSELAQKAGSLDFSGQDVMGWVAEGVDTSLLWAPNGDIQTSPESDEGQLQVTFEYSGGKIRLYEPQAGEGEAVLGCPVWLEIDAIATIRTDGGALDERFSVILSAARPAVVGFKGTLAPDQLAGALELVHPDSMLELDSFSLSGVVTEQGSFGQWLATYRADASQVLDGSDDTDEAPEGAAESDEPGLEGLTLDSVQVVVASWPAMGECGAGDAGAFALEDDVLVEELIPERWLERFSPGEPLALRWADGTETSLQVALSARGPACYRTDWFFPGAQLSFSPSIVVSTADGRWSAEYIGELALYFPGGGLDPDATISVKLTAANDQLESLGIELDTAVDGPVSLNFKLYWEPLSKAPSGRLRVSQEHELNCDSEGPPSEVAALTQDECLASRHEELITAQIGDLSTQIE